MKTTDCTEEELQYGKIETSILDTLMRIGYALATTSKYKVVRSEWESSTLKMDG